MTLINFSLLLGLGLAAIPIVLHLMMKAKPKKLEFPALRLLLARRTTNARRLRLRHLLLLAVRTILLVAAVLALARPSLPPARYGLRWWEWLLLGSVIAGALAIYRYLSQRAAQNASGAVLKDRQAVLRAWSVLGGLTAALLCVGVPWGLRVQAEVTSPRSEAAEDIPVAAVFIVDTSMSMTYRHESLTRLEQAQQIASDHLSILPTGSRVAVSGTAPNDGVVFQADLSGAQSRLESLKTQAQSSQLNRIVRRAIEAQDEDRSLVRTELGTPDTGDLFSREIYIFTDLSIAAWRVPDESSLRELLLQHDWLHVYLVDVSIADPVNLALREMSLSEDSAVSGSGLELSVTVTGTPAAKRAATVEVFLLDDEAGESRAAAPRHVTLEGTAPIATFPIAAREDGGFQQGLVRLDTSDPLSVDDIRYFTFGIRPKPSVLLVADREDDALYLRRALQPDGSDLTGDELYRTIVIPTNQFHQQELGRFDIVCLLNPRAPDDAAWASLRDYVEDGGALLAVMGGAKNLNPSAWRTDTARSVLAALPVTPISLRDDPGSFRYTDSHPILRPFEEYAPAKTELFRVLILRRWAVELFPDSRVVMNYSGMADWPALVERSVGAGQSMTLTTAVEFDSRNSRQWNDFPTNWTFVMMMDQIMQSLTGASEQRRNFISGMPVEIRVPADQRFTEYRLRRPEFRQDSGRMEIDQPAVIIDDAADPGHYLLRSFPDELTFRSAFAVNLNDAETDLTRVTPEQLDDVLGKDRYSSVSNPEDLERVVRVGRLGVEVFPVLLGLLVLLFCAEHLMANFFYDEEPTAVASTTQHAAS